MRNRFFSLIGIIIIIIIFIIPESIFTSVNGDRQQTMPIPVKLEESMLSSGLKTYRNAEFHVSLKYPAGWKKNLKFLERYDGDTGYFTVNAVAGGENMPVDEVVKFSAEHGSLPYGSKPEISKLEVDGQEARLITPDSDQPGAVKNQSELIVRYPQPVRIDNNNYYFFVMVGDTDHIMDIANTIDFIN